MPSSAVASEIPNAPDPSDDGFVARRRVMPLLIFFAVLGLVGYFVFTTVDRLVNTNSLDAQIATLEREITDLDWQAEQLSALVAYLDSDEYIERTARDDLGLVRPAEEAFAVEAPLRPGLRITRSPWWANLLPEPVASLAEEAGG